MKEILEKIYQKEISYAYYHHDVWLEIHQNDEHEIRKSEATSEEPEYIIKFKDYEKAISVDITEILTMMFNYVIGLKAN
jgi:hypothetical protein